MPYYRCGTRLLKNAPTRDASPPLERNSLAQQSFYMVSNLLFNL